MIPATKAGSLVNNVSARRALVRTVFEPDGFVEFCGILSRALWLGNESLSPPAPGDTVLVWMHVTYGRLVAARPPDGIICSL